MSEGFVCVPGGTRNILISALESLLDEQKKLWLAYDKVKDKEGIVETTFGHQTARYSSKKAIMDDWKEIDNLLEIVEKFPVCPGTETQE